MAFETLAGNKKTKELLNTIIKQNKFLHSYMFVGQSGIGKMLYAKEFSKRAMCLNREEICNKCKSCLEFDNNNHPDFFVIEPDGNSIKIEQIRELTNKIIEKPIVSEKKIYIINNAYLMTREAQNCLLKTLEEPPEFAIIILIVENEGNILNTIKSRCTKIYFENISDIEMKKLLEKKYGTLNLSDNMLKSFNGSMEKATKIMENKEFYNKIENIFSNIEKTSRINFLNNDEIYKNKENIDEILDYINIIFWNKLQENHKYINCLNIVQEARNRLARNANFDMTIDNMLIKIWEEIT